MVHNIIIDGVADVAARYHGVVLNWNRLLTATQTEQLISAAVLAE